MSPQIPLAHFDVRGQIAEPWSKCVQVFTPPPGSSVRLAGGQSPGTPPRPVGGWVEVVGRGHFTMGLAVGRIPLAVTEPERFAAMPAPEAIFAQTRAADEPGSTVQSLLGAPYDAAMWTATRAEYQAAIDADQSHNGQIDRSVASNTATPATAMPGGRPGVVATPAPRVLCGQPNARSVDGIDYITLRLPMEGAEGVHGGYLIFVSPEGEKEGEARRWRVVKGACGATIRVRYRRGNLEIDGNPYAFLHGHNLGGEPDLLLLVEQCTAALLERLQMRVFPRVRRALRAGEYVLGRVDVQRSTWLESTAQVRTLIDAQACAAAAARMKLWYEPGESLIVSPRSRSASLTVYAKHPEARKSLPRDLPERERHLAAVEGMARYEARLWAMWLRRRKLDRAAEWSPQVVTAVLDEQIARLPVPSAPVDATPQ